MRDGGRIAAAIAVLNDIETRHKPVRMALKNWGEGARYAGAKDRAFVAGLVLDALRTRRSNGWRMGEESARAAVQGVLRFGWGWSPDQVAEAFVEAPHGPGALTAAEAGALMTPRNLDDAPPDVAGDYPGWLEPQMTRRFGDTRAAEGAALAQRAPVDLRINLLKTDIARGRKALAVLGGKSVERLDTAVRLPAPAAEERAPAVEVLPAFAKGWFEVQDLGSQIAATCAGEIKGKQVLDYCAGGGGKTLALAAAMGNSGQIYAYDSDARRMTDLIPRAQRAGVRNLQLCSPMVPNALAGLEGRMDLVFVDAPCSGSGVWRRHPDAKWRLSPAQLMQRMAEQDQVLAAAAHHVKPGGRLIYVTCSLFVEENEDRIVAFLQRTPGFSEISPPRRFTPLGDGTDGFFIAQLELART